MTLAETVLAAEPCFEEMKPLPTPQPEKVTEEEHKRRMEKQFRDRRRATSWDSNPTAPERESPCSIVKSTEKFTTNDQKYE